MPSGPMLCGEARRGFPQPHLVLQVARASRSAYFPTRPRIRADAPNAHGPPSRPPAFAPQVLEIPSTQSPYDPSKDQLMKRVLQMLGEA